MKDMMIQIKRQDKVILWKHKKVDLYGYVQMSYHCL